MNFLVGTGWPLWIERVKRWWNPRCVPSINLLNEKNTKNGKRKRVKFFFLFSLLMFSYRRKCQETRCICSDHDRDKQRPLPSRQLHEWGLLFQELPASRWYSVHFKRLARDKCLAKGSMVLFNFSSRWLMTVLEASASLKVLLQMFTMLDWCTRYCTIWRWKKQLAYYYESFQTSWFLRWAWTIFKIFSSQSVGIALLFIEHAEYHTLSPNWSSKGSRREQQVMDHFFYPINSVFRLKGIIFVMDTTAKAYELNYDINHDLHERNKQLSKDMASSYSPRARAYPVRPRKRWRHRGKIVRHRKDNQKWHTSMVSSRYLSEAKSRSWMDEKYQQIFIIFSRAHFAVESNREL